MKKIIQIVPSFELGGVQTGILYSIADLRKKIDYEVLVIGFVDKKWLENLSPEIQNHIIWTGSKSIWRGYWKAYKILKKLNPDVVISCLWKSVLLSVTYKLLHRKVKLLGFFYNANTAHFIDAFFQKLLCRMQDLGLADSKTTYNFLTNSLHARNIQVVACYFSACKMPFHKRNYDPSNIKIAYFGRFVQQKRIDRAIEFCRILHEKGVPFHFDLYGEIDPDKIPKSIREYGLENIVSFKRLLTLEEVSEAMKNYDFLLQLSDYEGMALSVVEAMSTGLVPIVTPVGEISNYSEDGKNAIWLKPDFDNNLYELADEFLKIARTPDLYQKMSLAAHENFKNYPDYTESMIKVLDKL